MARGRGKHHNGTYQTRRTPRGQHPDFQNGRPLNPKKAASKDTPAPTRSWWTDAANFYSTAKAELGRMSAQNKFGRLNTEIE